MCLAYSDSHWLVGIWLKTSTVYRRNDKTNDKTDNDGDLPTIKELLLTKLQKQGFTTKDQGLYNTAKVEEVASKEKRASVDQSKSAQSNDSGGSLGKHAYYTFYYRNRRPVFSNVV